MSIEFKNSRWGRNRNSRLFKKTRRAAMKKIDAPHLPMRVQTGKNSYWSQTSTSPSYLQYAKVTKFLMKRVGRPIDKVFSEFLTEAKKFKQVENLKELFYSHIDYEKNKRRWGKAEGFYISNGILNYKDDWAKDKEELTPEKFRKYNEEHWDISVFDIFKPLHNTGPSPIGKFWVEIKGQYMLLPVYAVYDDKWNYYTKGDSNTYPTIWKARKKRTYDYLKEFTRCSIVGKGDWYRYEDYNYFYYIVRISDIEKYKEETFKK